MKASDLGAPKVNLAVAADDVLPKAGVEGKDDCAVEDVVGIPKDIGAAGSIDGVFCCDSNESASVGLLVGGAGTPNKNPF